MPQQTSNQNTSTPGKNPTSLNIPPIECHHLGHLEAIPIRHGSDLCVVRRACVYREGDIWSVMNYNLYGPDQDICYRLPGPKNHWIAKVKSVAAMNDLNDLIVSHETKEQKNHEYIYYRTVYDDGDDIVRSVVVECVKGRGEGRIRDVTTSAKKISALQRKMGFLLLKI